MSTANDFLQKLQSATVKSTVQQKQKSRPNASAAELSKMLMAATGQGESVLPETTSVTQMPVQEKKSYEAVKEKSGAADLSEKKAAASSKTPSFSCKSTLRFSPSRLLSATNCSKAVSKTGSNRAL